MSDDIGHVAQGRPFDPGKRDTARNEAHERALKGYVEGRKEMHIASLKKQARMCMICGQEPYEIQAHDHDSGAVYRICRRPSCRRELEKMIDHGVI